MTRLIWLVGPPGAGKTTSAAALLAGPRPPRILELAELLHPLVDPAKPRKGMMRAKGLLIQAIRAVELEPANGGLPPLVVITAIQSEAGLFPLEEEEVVLLLLPPRDRWEQQFMSRPPQSVPGSRAMSLEDARGWYTRYAGWVEQGHPVHRVGSVEEVCQFIGGSR